MVLLPAAAVLGGIYGHKVYSAYKSNMYGRRGYKRSSAVRKYGRLPRSYAIKTHKRSKKTTRVPKTLRISRASQGVGWWPRIGFSPFPQVKSAQLKYHEQFTISGSTGGITGTSIQYGLNCLFDPNLTGVGHQPMGFDEYTAIYKMYHVWRVDIKIRPDSDRTNMFLVAQINSSQDTTAVTGIDMNTAGERSNCAMINLLGYTTENIIYKQFNIADIEGNNVNDDNYSATTSGNPGNKPTLNLACARNDGGDNGTVTGTIEFVYHVKFFNKLTLPPS